MLSAANVSAIRPTSASPVRPVRRAAAIVAIPALSGIIAATTLRGAR